MLNKKISGAGLLLVASMSLFAVSISYADTENRMTVSHRDASNQSANAAGNIKANVDPSKLRCQSVRCQNRQIRRLKRAKCRLLGGSPSITGRKCTINP